MSQICIASERLLELCAQARHALPHFQQGFQTVRAEPLPFSYQTAAEVLNDLETLSRQASRLAGAGYSSVCFNSNDANMLSKLLEVSANTLKV